MKENVLEKCERAQALVDSGLRLDAACERVGISLSQLYNWRFYTGKARRQKFPNPNNPRRKKKNVGKSTEKS